MRISLVLLALGLLPGPALAGGSLPSCDSPAVIGHILDRQTAVEAKTWHDGFTIASTPYTTIKQGEQRTVDITIDREDGFDRNLALQVAAPKGLTATLATRRLTPSKGNVVTLNVVADKNAPVGRRVITVAAISDYGYAQPTTTGVHLIVEGS